MNTGMGRSMTAWNEVRQIHQFCKTKTGNILVCVLLFSGSCKKTELIDPVGFEISIPADSIVFAQIGDYGFSGSAEGQVAEMVKSWNPDFIITTGDNNYPGGKFNTLKENISQYYGDYIYNFDAPQEFRCNGKAFDEGLNRFFPTPGNHDSGNADGLIPYYNFFTLPGNESYYKFSWGPVTFFSINTVEGDLQEQKNWLEQQRSVSVSPFQIVFFHYSPYSSGPHGSFSGTQWDYNTLGIDIIFTGHDHLYERIEKKGEEDVHYIINGLGGCSIYECDASALPSDLFSIFCYNNDYGAVKGLATKEKIIIEFYAISSSSQPADRIVITK
jgi:tartrate-resistant acid phosphatase type 5